MEMFISLLPIIVLTVLLVISIIYFTIIYYNSGTNKSYKSNKILKHSHKPLPKATFFERVDGKETVTKDFYREQNFLSVEKDLLNKREKELNEIILSINSTKK